MSLQSKWKTHSWEKTKQKPGDIVHFILSLDSLCCTLKAEALYVYKLINQKGKMDKRMAKIHA